MITSQQIAQIKSVMKPFHQCLKLFSLYTVWIIFVLLRIYEPHISIQSEYYMSERVFTGGVSVGHSFQIDKHCWYLLINVREEEHHVC